MKSRLFMIIVGLVGLQCAAAFACHGPTTSEQKCFSKCKLTGESDESCRAYCHKNFPENATSVLAGGAFHHLSRRPFLHVLSRSRLL